MQPTPEYTLPASFTPQDREWLFNELMTVYDLADKVMATVAREDTKDRPTQLELIKPFITQTTNSMNIISAFYTEIARGLRPITPEVKDTMEGAFRNFFEALDELIHGMQEKLMPEGGNI